MAPTNARAPSEVCTRNGGLSAVSTPAMTAATSVGLCAAAKAPDARCRYGERRRVGSGVRRHPIRVDAHIGHEFAGDGTRLHHRDPHAQRHGDRAQRLHEPFDREFRRAVRLIEGLPDNTADAGDGDDPPTRRAQMRQRRSRHIQGAEEIDLENAADIVDGFLFQRRDMARTGVVHDCVDAVVGDDRRNAAGHRIRR